MKKGLLILGFLLMGGPIQRASELSNREALRVAQRCHFFPANKMRFPVRADGKQITYKQFRKILEAAKNVYQPIFAAAGLGRLVVAERWHDDDVNACASVGRTCYEADHGVPEKNKDRYIEIYGGVARHPYMSPEGLMLVVCHELGHHFGGYPQYTDHPDKMSSEGQSDYFATAKCARMIYNSLSPKSNQNWAWANKNRIPLEVQRPCLSRFPAGSDAAIFCARSSLAALAISKVLATAGNEDPSQIAFNRKDQTVVQVTNESYSPAQCRLDTYLAGARCDVDPRVPFSRTNAQVGACTQQGTYGVRPQCWFKN